MKIRDRTVITRKQPIVSRHVISFVNHKLSSSHTDTHTHSLHMYEKHMEDTGEKINLAKEKATPNPVRQCTLTVLLCVLRLYTLCKNREIWWVPIKR